MLSMVVHTADLRQSVKVHGYLTCSFFCKSLNYTFFFQVTVDSIMVVMKWSNCWEDVDECFVSLNSTITPGICPVPVGQPSAPAVAVRANVHRMWSWLSRVWIYYILRQSLTRRWLGLIFPRKKSSGKHCRLHCKKAERLVTLRLFCKPTTCTVKQRDIQTTPSWPCLCVPSIALSDIRDLRSYQKNLDNFSISDR